MNENHEHTVEISATTPLQRLTTFWFFAKAAVSILFTGTASLTFKKKITT